MTLTLWLSLAAIHLAAVIIPGANFLAVTQTALTHSQRAGLWTVRGIATGTSLYVTAGMVGFAAAVSQSPFLLTALRLLGAIYFAYMGLRMIVRVLRPPSDQVFVLDASAAFLPPPAAYRRGLVTSLSNPAAAVYFLSFFTGFVPAAATPLEKLLIGLILVTITFTWYTGVAMTFSRSRIRQLYLRAMRPMSVAFGFLWLGLAFKLAMS
jgi:threonine/homoserine/homoserine lactone efflux protein